MTLRFRPTEVGDLALLSRWLSTPHVKRWWPDESDLSSITEKYLPRINRTDPTETFIVVEDGAPVGFVQRYRLSDTPEWRDAMVAAVGPIDGVGIDYYVGDVANTGRGLGTELIDEFVGATFDADTTTDAVVVAVQQDNVASWRALESAGFIRVFTGQLQSDDPSDRGPAYVYVRQRQGVPTLLATTVDPPFQDYALAQLYDQLCPWPERDDLEFYLPLVMASGAVLDVGCGTGQLLRRARSNGHRGRLVGLDPAEGMLTVAREEPRVEWILGDLSTTSWTDTFDLIVMSGHAFQVFLTDVQLHTALSRMRAALTETGLVAFETRNPEVRTWELWTGAAPVEVQGDQGAVVRHVERVDEPDDDRVTFFGAFSSTAWSEPKVSHSTLRFLGVRALEQFLTDAGLEIVELFGDWDSSALTRTSPEIIVLAKRA